MKRHSWLGQLGLVLPFLIPVVLFSVIPLLRGIYLGFTDYRFGFEMRFNGLENYRYMLTDSYFWSSFRVGAIWTIGTTLGQVALGLGLAQLAQRRSVWPAARPHPGAGAMGHASGN